VDRVLGIIEIINLCEQLAGQEAKVKRIPYSSVKKIRCGRFFGFFEWGQNISDRLAFV
jgi:hypothetical protein